MENDRLNAELIALPIICEKRKDYSQVFFWHTICDLLKREQSFIFNTNMKDRRNYIVEKAFEVFMSEGYESASITVLQEELGMSRGAIYRYFKSKEELFFDVIDRYVFGQIDRFMPKVDEETTLIELIEYLYRYHKKLDTYLEKQNMETRFLNFTALMIQAAKYYPEFTKKMKKINDENIKLWKIAIINSIAKNEIRDNVDVNILAGIFSAGSNNLEDGEHEFELKFVQKAGAWKRDKEYLYSLIEK